jgi:hypothetical protein
LMLWLQVPLMSTITQWRCIWDTMIEALRIWSYVRQAWIVHLLYRNIMYTLCRM